MLTGIQFKYLDRLMNIMLLKNSIQIKIKSLLYYLLILLFHGEFINNPLIIL